MNKLDNKTKLLKNTCPNCLYENRLPNFFCTKCGFNLKKSTGLVPKLILIKPDNTGQVFKLDDQKNIIGRHNTNTVFIDDEQISRKHAMIYFDQENYWIEDLRSKNGVYVNGKKIALPQRLRNGNLIKLGASMLRFELSNRPD